MENTGYHFYLPSSVISDKRLSPGAKLLLAQLIVFQLLDRNCSLPSKFLAKLNGVNERTIQRWKTQLDKCGYLNKRCEEVYG